ncbi:MAG: M4 family metallopeptidase [Actinocatenispora sp.]
MSRTLAAVGTAVLVAAGLVAGGLGVGPTATASARPAGPGRPTAVDRASTALDAHRTAVHATGADAFHVDRVVTDPDGATHVRYDRTYHGLTVYGGDIVVHTRADGSYLGASVAQQRPITVDTMPAITAGAAVAKARAAQHGRTTGVAAPRLVVDAVGAVPRLAYDTVVSGVQADGRTPSRDHVLVDADTGATIRSFDEIETVRGTGHGLHVGTVPLDTTYADPLYLLKDPTRGNGYTCDLHHGTSGCPIATDDNNDWSGVAVDAQYGAGVTWDYYKDNFGRSGVLGDGAGIVSRVNYGNNYLNAFWDGTQMTYGDGGGNPPIELDITGHEITHGYTQAIAGLGYTGDVGGINESLSDIFGTMIEFSADNAVDPGDYTVGEIFGNGTPVRYLYHPSLDGGSFDCWSSAVPPADPHYASGVGNHFFFLAAEGSGATRYGTSPTCNGSTVTGVGRDTVAAILFRALNVYFTSEETYAQARADTLAAAGDLYGHCGTEYRAVQAAWSAVAVSGSDGVCAIRK